MINSSSNQYQLYLYDIITQKTHHQDKSFIYTSLIIKNSHFKISLKISAKNLWKITEYTLKFRIKILNKVFKINLKSRLNFDSCIFN